MPKYNTTMIANKLIGKTDEKTVQIVRDDGKKISADDVKSLFKVLKKDLDDKNKPYKIFVRGMGVTRYHTLTKDNELNIKNDVEYFEGRVKNAGKFTDFFFLQITVVDESPVQKKNTKSP